MKRFYATLLVNALLLTLIFNSNSFAGDATKWNLDKAHSSVNFMIMHIMTPVHGKFEDFNIDLHFDPENLEESSIDVTIQAASINTGWGPRDDHLRTADWFDAAEYPVMSFKSSSITSKGEGNFVAKGKLKIKDIETEIELPFKLLGVKQAISADMKQMLGDVDEIASFEVSYTLNREEYNIGTGTSTPGTAAKVYREVVGKEVSINIALEVKRKIS
jgi:polyisoprenoid-binding protein YceI